MSGLYDPSRHLVGGVPRSVIVPARIARVLDRTMLDDYRRRARGMDSELDATLAALHAAGLEWADQKSTSEPGTPEVLSAEVVKTSKSDLIDVATAAGTIGCTDRQVRNLCASDQLPGTKVAGRWLVTPEALAGYLADRN